MKVAFVSRYPRVDSPPWKREVARGLHDAGCEVAAVYSRSRLVDQLDAGLKEFGPLGSVRRYARLRPGGGADATTEAADSGPGTLAALVRSYGGTVVECVKLGDDACLAGLRALAPDLLVLVGADLVPRSVLEVPRIGTINAHYGLLPAYRGMNVTEWSVYNGDPLGVTVHLVDPGIDTGDILQMEEVPVERGDTWETLRAKHQGAASRLLLRAALALRDGTEERRTQRPEEGRQYYRMHPAVLAVAEERLRERAAAAPAG